MTLKHALFGIFVGGSLPLAAAQVPQVAAEPWWAKYAVAAGVAAFGILAPLAQRYLAYRRQMRALAGRDRAAALLDDGAPASEVTAALQEARRDEALARVLDAHRKAS